MRCSLIDSIRAAACQSGHAGGRSHSISHIFIHINPCIAIASDAATVIIRCIIRHIHVVSIFFFFRTCTLDTRITIAVSTSVASIFNSELLVAIIIKPKPMLSHRHCHASVNQLQQ